VGFSVRDLLRQAAERPELLEDPEFREVYEALAQTIEQNHLLAFEPHPAKDGRQPQLEFIEAMTRIVVAQAGNQFGKSTILTVCALRECLPDELLPPLLKRTRRYSGPVEGWILVPTEDKIFDSFQPAFEEWCPPEGFVGGNWGKAFNGARMMLRLKQGTIYFKTYKQDASTLGGARLHFAGYDEPPPRKHREETRMRLVRYGGHEMFAFTPLDTNTGYLRKALFKQRAHEDITLVRGSIYDNPHLDRSTVDATLGDLSDLWRQAREFGDFVNLGGLVYPEFERCVLKERPTVDEIRGQDVVVGIDNGIRNAGIVFEAFDRDNSCTIFDELLLQDATPDQYAKGIRQTLQRWGLDERNVHFVVDPSARSRGQVNAETVMAALAREGIYCNAGQNDREAGIGQGRIRMAHGRLKVSPECRGLIDEADDYVGEEPGEGKDDSHVVPVKGNDHRLDAARYAWMERFWDPVMEQDAPNRTLGWTPGVAPDLTRFPSAQPEVGAMGSMG
jgi:hypothetical protein